MKSIILLACLCTVAAAIPASAQSLGPRGFIGIGVGPSTPLGGLSGASAPPGAGRGYTSTMLNAAYRFEGRLGVAGTFSYSQYDGGDDDDWWEVAGIAVGPAYTLPVGSRTAVDLKGLVGFFAFTPVIDSHASARDIGAGVGVEGRALLRHDLYRRLALFMDAGFVVSAASFDFRENVYHRALISGVGLAIRPF